MSYKNLKSVTNGITLSIMPGEQELDLASELLAVEGLSTTGLAVRSAADTWITRTITAGAGITVNNGDGISGNPEIIATGGGLAFTDITPGTLVVDNGYFLTAIGTYDLPAIASQGDLLVLVCDAAAGVIVDAPAGDFIRIGLSITADGGTITSTAIGDSATFRFRSATQTWHATAVTGNWTIS